MFENIGGKIKGFAKFVCWLGIIGSIILGVLSNVDGVPLLGILVAITGSIASWVGSFLTYGFGQLVENSDILVKQNNDLLNSDLFKNISPQENTPSFVWDPVSETAAVRVSETNIQCTNCHQVQFKGNETCTQCGAKFTVIINNDIEKA